MELKSNAPGGPIETAWDRHRFEMKLVNPANKRKHNVIVVGTGLAGASAAAAGSSAGASLLGASAPPPALPPFMRALMAAILAAISGLMSLSSLISFSGQSLRRCRGQAMPWMPAGFRC